MSDSEEPPTTLPEDSAAARPSRHRSWLRGVLLTAVLFGLAIAGSLWASRPHWRTYISPVNEPSGLRLAVKMPENWALDNRGSATDYDTNLFFYKKPATGIDQWFDTITGHMDDNEDSIGFQLSSRSDRVYEAATLDKTIPQMQAEEKRSGAQVTWSHVSYSVGSGLEISITRSPSMMHRIQEIILIPKTSRAQKIVVRLIFQGHSDHFDRFRSVFEEVARSMRLLTP